MALTKTWQALSWISAGLAALKLVHTLSRLSDGTPLAQPPPPSSNVQVRLAPDASSAVPGRTPISIRIPFPDDADIDVQMVVANLEMLDEPHRAMMRTRLWLLAGTVGARSFLEPELRALAEAAPSARFWIGMVSLERRFPLLLSYVSGRVNELSPETAHDPETLIERGIVTDAGEATEIWRLFSLLPTNTTTTLKTFGTLRSEWQSGANGPVLVRIPPPSAAMLAEHAPNALPRELKFFLPESTLAALTEAAEAEDTVLSKVFERSWREAKPKLSTIRDRDGLPRMRKEIGDAAPTVLFVPQDIAAELERRAVELDTSKSSLAEAAVAIAGPKRRKR